MIALPPTTFKMAVCVIQRKENHRKLLGIGKVKSKVPDNLCTRIPPPTPGKEEEPAQPTWSPVAQKTSFRACQVGVASEASAREVKGTSSEDLASLPNTQVFTSG